MIVPRPLPLLAHSRISLYFLIVTIWLLSTSHSTAQVSKQPQEDEGGVRSAVPKQSIVHGRVIYDDTRRPLRRVYVTIYDPAAKSNTRHFIAWTDGRGEFQIKDVPAGKYFVEVDAPGIIRSGLYNSEDGQKELTSVTVDGTSKSEVNVRVKRGGAVSGKVSYADGDPVINATIRILRKKEGKWTPVYVFAPSDDRSHTDDRGAYRLSGLPPGEYLIGAAEEKMGIEMTARDNPDGSNLLNRAVLATTYYDGATSLADATILTIQVGAEETNINITLADRAVHGISGVVTLKGENRPIARARISLKRRGEDSPFASQLEEPVTNTDSQGQFTFDEVQDGSYTITVTPPRSYLRYTEFPTAPQSADSAQKFVGKSLEVNVVGADLANLNIEVSSGSRISGIVVVDGGKPMPPSVFVYPQAAEGSSLQPASIHAQPNGAFTVEGLPAGVIYLRASVPPDNKYYTKSVTVGKTDLLRGPLTVKEDEDITNVRIVISPDIALLSGRALASDGKTPLSAVNVLLISAESDQHKIFGVTNADGSFRLNGAPGEYVAIVMRPGEFPYQLSNEALKLRSSKAQRIVLQAGENNGLDIVASNDK
jgi:hypothetical protein